MAAGYKILALWLARAGVSLRASGGERIATITTIYRAVANITSNT